MEKIIKFVDEKTTYNQILVELSENDTIILDLGDIDYPIIFLNYLLKIYRLCKSKNKDLVFLSSNEINSDLKKYFRFFKNYKEYKNTSIYFNFQVKLYINNDSTRKLLKNIFSENGFLVKERKESNFLNKEHDCRMKDIYVIDYDSYKKEKLIEIEKIKKQNPDTVVILLISSESREFALKMVNLGIDSIIEKPINQDELLSIVKKLANASNLKCENMELNAKIRTLYENIENEISLAKDIQQSFLPENNIKFNGYNISYIFEPSQGIGGDFCDVVELDKDKIAIVFADISGHGIPSSLLSSMLKVFIRSEIRQYENTNKFLENLNEKVINIFPKGKFVSMFYMIIDTKNNVMKYSKAAQEPALYLSENKIMELETDGQVLGLFSKKMFPDMVVFEQKEIEFDKDAVLLLYTDGITEAEKDNEMYGLDKLKEEFVKNGKNIEEIKESLSTYLLEDDLTLLTVYRDE